MPVSILWLLVLSWGAGLIAAPHLPRAVVLAAVALCGLLQAARRPPRRGRPVLLIAVFLAAVSTGRPTDLRLVWGPWGGRKTETRGLSNPSFRPLVTAAPARQRSEPDAAGIPEMPARRPQWCSETVWGLVQGILLNRRERIEPSWATAFRGVGAAHILAVSGLHIGIIMSVGIFLLRAGGAGRILSALLVLPPVWGYILLVGLPSSAVRAGLMATIGAVVWAAGSRADPRRILPAAVLLILVLSPRMLASVGFLLSVAAVGGIVALLPGRSPAPPRGGRRMVNRLGALLRVSLAAQVGVTAPQIVIFGTVCPWSALVNLVAVPLLGLWLPAALGALALDAFGVPGAVPAGALCEGLGRILLWWIALWSRLPAAQLPAPVWAALPAILILPLWQAGGRGRIAALLGGALIIWSPLTARGVSRVAFLDVGQGDAIVVESARPRRTVVIDAGYRFLDFDMGEQVVGAYLRMRGVKRIDALIATHTDHDHIGGLPALARAFHTALFLRGGWTAADPAGARAFEAALAGAGVPRVILRAGDRLVLGRDAVIEVLAGAEGELDGYEANDRSLVLRLQLGGRTVLLTGDLERTGEARLRPRWGRLGCDLLKVPHHGSSDALSPDLLAAAAPRTAVISVGRDNRHGHPAPSTVSALEGSGARVWRTDRRGAYVLTARH